MFNLKTKSIIMDKPLGRNKIDELIKNIYEDDSILFFYFKRILLTALSNNKWFLSELTVNKKMLIMVMNYKSIIMEQAQIVIGKDTIYNLNKL